MPGLDELDLSLGAIECAKHAINAVAGIAENVADTPVVQTLDEEIAVRFGTSELLAANDG